MKKFLKSKPFVVLMPLLIFAIGIAAGVCLGYQPIVSGRTSGSMGITSGSTSTTFVFHVETAIGYWLLALALAVITLLLCILIRSHYLSKAASNPPANGEKTD